jgi:hypothetical protein
MRGSRDDQVLGMRAGRRGRGEYQNNQKVLGMRAGRSGWNESRGENQNIVAMGGSGGRGEVRNQSHRDDQKLLFMTGSRNQIQSVEDDQAVEEKEEVQGEMVQLDEEARMKCEREWSDQCRSRFAMVRRKLDNSKKEFTRWFAEMRKPKEFGRGLIQIGGYKTDVEAAVAASVVARVIEIALKLPTDHQNADGRRGSNPPLKCHDYLIGLKLQNSPLPDCSSNKSIKKFVDSCVEIYMKMVNKTMPMPQDKTMADVITLYQEAVHHTQKYKEGEVPPLKQSRRGENEEVEVEVAAEM